MVKSYDLVCFAESKLDNTDIVLFHGLYLFYSTEKTESLPQIWGNLCLLKNYILKVHKAIDSDSDYILWLEIVKNLMNLEENLILGTVYLPPEMATSITMKSF